MKVLPSPKVGSFFLTILLDYLAFFIQPMSSFLSGCYQTIVSFFESKTIEDHYWPWLSFSKPNQRLKTSYTESACRRRLDCRLLGWWSDCSSKTNLSLPLLGLRVVCPSYQPIYLDIANSPTCRTVSEVPSSSWFASVTIVFPHSTYILLHAQPCIALLDYVS